MLDNLIITLFKTKWQYYFPDVSRIQPGGGGGGGGGGGVGGFSHYLDQMGFEDFSSSCLDLILILKLHEDIPNGY